MHWLNGHRLFIGVLLLIIGINVFFFYFTPEEIVRAIGVENVYVIVFLLATVGGLSSFTGVTLYAAIPTFAAGGASPVLLGFAGGIGIFISDSIFYHLALYGKATMPQRTNRILERVTDRLLGFSKEKMLLFTYLYQSFLPLPSDVLMVFLVLAGYKYRTIAPIFLAASITLALLLAFFGSTL